MIAFSAFVILFNLLTFHLVIPSNHCARLSSVFTDSIFFTLESAFCGIILFFILYSSCILRRRYVSRKDFIIDSVKLSAYNITSHLRFLEARHIICISEVVERKNPSLSASNIAIRLTSGKSIPSLSKFTQTIISI